MQVKMRGIIDRTGSMAAYHKPVVEGVNAYLDKVRADRQGADADTTIMIFDSMGFDVIRKGRAGDLDPIREDEFVPRALTPLFDALASGLNDNVDEGPDVRNVLFILTDGLENASQKYKNLATIRALVEEKQKKGWIIIYLGANIDAWQQASDLGIPPERAMNFHARGTNSQPAQGFVGRMMGKKSNPVAKAMIAAAGLGLAYALFRPGDAQAKSLGFTEQDRNDAMGVVGVEKNWQQAVQEDVAAFSEPFDSMFDLPQELQQQISDLPHDFDPALGSMDASGNQTGGLTTDDEIISADDVPSIVNDASGSADSDGEGGGVNGGGGIERELETADAGDSKGSWFGGSNKNDTSDIIDSDSDSGGDGGDGGGGGDGGSGGD